MRRRLLRLLYLIAPNVAAAVELRRAIREALGDGARYAAPQNDRPAD